MSIHIKPSHRGKFTEYKKKHHVTTEQALHSKNPHVRKMANFAKNAAKWHHADGGQIPYVTDIPQAPVTPGEREAWNKYTLAMRNQPGYGVVNWDHNQEFQQQAMQASGFDPSRVGAIQADMLSRNQSMPGSVHAGPQGFSKVDNWVGNKTKDQTYTKYEYLHYDKNNNLYPGTAGHIGASTEPMTQGQLNNWTDSAYQWKSNDQGVSITASPQEIKQKLYQPLTATTPGLNKTSFYEPGLTDYSIDSVRMGSGGKVNPVYVESPLDPRYRAYKDSLIVSRYGLNIPDTPPKEWYDAYDELESINHAYITPQREVIDGIDSYSYRNLEPKNKVSLRKINKLPIGIKKPDRLTFEPKEVQVPSYIPKVQGEWYSNRIGVPIDAEDVSSLYNEDGTKKYAMGGKIKMKKMDDGGINLQLNSSQMMMGALAGADMLATKFLYNPQVAAAEAKTKRNLLTPVTAPNQFYGTGQGMYAKGGITRGKGDYSYAPYSANGGRVDDQFEDNINPNTIVEGGEHMVLPNGLSSPIVGDAHSDPSGGEPRNYPEGTRIFSKKLKADKQFVAAITDGKIKKAMSYADIAKRFDTKKDAEDMNNNDPIIARTRKMNFQLKNAKLDEIFNQQELSKGYPQGPALMFGGATLAEDGVYVKGKSKDILDMQQKMLTEHPDWVKEALDKYGVPNAGKFDDGLDGPRTRYVKNYVDSKMTNPDGTIAPLEPSALKPITANPIGPRLDDGSFYSQWEPRQTTVPEMPGKALSPTPTTKKSSGSFKFKGVSGASDFIPEAFAAVQNMTNFPIYAGKVNPQYINPAEVNIQAALNRNISTATGVRNTGNAAVDNARGAFGAAELYDANNQLYQNKFNADQQSRQYANAFNANSKTRADELNMKSMDDFWDKVTRRQAIKEQSNQAIVESVYQKNAMKRLENTSLGIYNQMMKDWEWDPKTGKYRPKQQPLVYKPLMQTTV